MCGMMCGGIAIKENKENKKTKKQKKNNKIYIYVICMHLY